MNEPGPVLTGGGLTASGCSATQHSHTPHTTNPPSSSPSSPLARLQGLLELFEELGLHVPLRRTGPSTYCLGSARLAVRLVCGKLVGRAGGGAVDIFGWLGRQPMQI